MESATEPPCGITRLGPFRVNPNGLISPATADHFPAFSVRWRGRFIRARMVPGPAGPEMGKLDIAARIGRIPSTAGLDAPACRRLREDALALLRHLPECVPAGMRVRLAPDHAVVMETVAELRLPISAVDLVTEVARVVLTLAPYFDVLDEAGAGLPAGTSST